jgi:anti-sigma factor RsiW
MAPPPDRPLRCVELVELVTAYLDDALTPDERRRFASHLAACGDCAAYVVQFGATIAGIAATRPSALTPAARAELLEAFRADRRERDDGTR